MSNGYNLTHGGFGIIGFQHTETTKAKISKNHVGFQGKKHTQAFKDKMSGENHWTKRQSFSESTRQKMSISATLAWKKRR